eukprot:scaffold4345_cov92-Isochrysis_galbana.AAC.1
MCIRDSRHPGRGGAGPAVVEACAVDPLEQRPGRRPAAGLGDGQAEGEQPRVVSEDAGQQQKIKHGVGGRVGGRKGEEVTGAIGGTGRQGAAQAQRREVSMRQRLEREDPARRVTATAQVMGREIEAGRCGAAPEQFLQQVPHVVAVERKAEHASGRRGVSAAAGALALAARAGRLLSNFLAGSHSWVHRVAHSAVRVGLHTGRASGCAHRSVHSAVDGPTRWRTGRRHLGRNRARLRIHTPALVPLCRITRVPHLCGSDLSGEPPTRPDWLGRPLPLGQRAVERLRRGGTRPALQGARDWLASRRGPRRSAAESCGRCVAFRTSMVLQGALALPRAGELQRGAAVGSLPVHIRAGVQQCTDRGGAAHLRCPVQRGPARVVGCVNQAGAAGIAALSFAVACGATPRTATRAAAAGRAANRSLMHAGTRAATVHTGLSTPPTAGRRKHRDRRRVVELCGEHERCVTDIRRAHCGVGSVREQLTDERRTRRPLARLSQRTAAAPAHERVDGRARAEQRQR